MMDKAEYDLLQRTQRRIMQVLIEEKVNSMQASSVLSGMADVQDYLMCKGIEEVTAKIDIKDLKVWLRNRNPAVHGYHA